MLVLSIIFRIMNRSKKISTPSKFLAFAFVLIGIFVIVRFTGPSAKLDEPFDPNDLFLDNEQASVAVSEDKNVNDFVFEAPSEEPVDEEPMVESVNKKEENNNNEISKKIVVPNLKEIVILDVPFTSQAPFAEWDDPRQQDGCEEASVLMAIYWAEGKELTKQIALDEILAISEYENKEYGSYKDTSAADTFERIVVGYFDHDNGKVVYSMDKEDIVDELRRGNVVIVPAKGQVLANPNFTPPGPEHHMLTIIGYDPNTAEFITNDPGTRLGKGYRYNEDVLYEAIHDYTTSNSPVAGTGDKVMIVIGK